MPLKYSFHWIDSPETYIYPTGLREDLTDFQPKWSGNVGSAGTNSWAMIA